MDPSEGGQEDTNLEFADGGKSSFIIKTSDKFDLNIAIQQLIKLQKQQVLQRVKKYEVNTAPRKPGFSQHETLKN